MGHEKCRTPPPVHEINQTHQHVSRGVLVSLSRGEILIMEGLILILSLIVAFWVLSGMITSWLFTGNPFASESDAVEQIKKEIFKIDDENE